MNHPTDLQSTLQQFGRPFSLLLPAVIFCLAALALSPVSFAVDFIEIVEEEKNKPAENQNGFRIEHFGQWIFNEQIDANGARKKLAEKLEAEAESVQSLFQLTDAQKEKLALAGLGDIQAFMHEYEKIRANFEKNLHDQQAMQNIWQEIQPLQLKYRGQMFGKGSLFAKIMEHLLDEQQLSIMQEMVREQSKYKYQAAVRQTIMQIDQVAPLMQKNREKLLLLIDQHTYPPKAIPNSNQTHYLTYYVLGQFDQIPKDELQPLFSKATWEVLQKQIKQGVRMKRNLVQQGLVPDKD